MRPDDRKRAALVAVLAVLVYLPTLAFQLVWDDPMLLELTRARWAAGGPTSLLTSEFVLGDPSDHTGYFRPVVLASLVADGAIGGGKPWAYHLTNVLLHAGVSVLGFLLLRRILEDGRAALFGALLFAAHPVHVEAVAFVSGRTDLWAAVFVLMATLAYVRWATLWSSVFLALAALSKESALMAIPAWLTWDALNVLRPRGRRWWLIGALAAVAAVVAIRWGIAHVPLRGTGEAAAFALLLPRLVVYLKLLAVPWPMSAYYTPADLHLRLIDVSGALAALGVFGLAWSAAHKRAGAAGLAWTLWFLVPVLGVAAIRGGAAAERFLYIPSLGICLAAAALWRPLLEEKRRTAMLVAGVVLVFFSSATLWRSRVWKGELTLYTDMAKTSPDAFVAHFNLGNELAQVERYDEAEAHLKRAVHIAPDRADAWNNLGSVQLRLGKQREAERSYAEAVRLKPDFSVALDNAALLRRQRFEALASAGRWSEALALLESNPQRADAGPLAEAGKTLNEAGRWPDAERALLTAIRVDPDHAGAHGYLGYAYLAHGEPERAIPLLTRGVSLDPQDATARYNLAVSRLATGDVAGARADREALLRVDPARAAALDALIARAVRAQ